MNFIYETNRIYMKDEHSRIIAEVTFPDISPQVVNINHTFVDASLRGKGIAGQLMEAAAKEIRGQHKKAVPTCEYAVQWFDKHREYEDILTSF